MLAPSSTARIFLHNEPVDMRKGFEGLCATVEQVFAVEVTSGAYFVFLNRLCDRMKVLYWDGDGLAIWYKRLEQGRFPRKQDGKVILHRREFLMLLEGVTPGRISRRYKADKQALCPMRRE